jgi:hypothetical protein
MAGIRRLRGAVPLLLLLLACAAQPLAASAPQHVFDFRATVVRDAGATPTWRAAPVLLATNDAGGTTIATGVAYALTPDAAAVTGALRISVTASYAAANTTTRTVFNLGGLIFRINPSPIDVGVAVHSFADFANANGASTRCSQGFYLTTEFAGYASWEAGVEETLVFEVNADGEVGVPTINGLPFQLIGFPSSAEVPWVPGCATVRLDGTSALFVGAANGDDEAAGAATTRFLGTVAALTLDHAPPEVPAVARRHPTAATLSQSVISASSEYGHDGSEDSMHAFDEYSRTTFWTQVRPSGWYDASGSYPGPAFTTLEAGAVYTGEWLQVQLPAAVTIRSYALKTRYSSLDRGPRAFKLAGSADGATWTTLDTRTGVTDWALDGFVFGLDVPATFAFFRLCVHENNGDSWLSVADFALYDAPAARVPRRYPSAALLPQSIVSASSVYSGGGEYTALSFDDSFSTSWWTQARENWYATDGSGRYTGASSTLLDGESYAGEWLQVQLPAAITLSSYSLNTWYNARGPRAFKLLGSADGAAWVTLDTRAGITGYTDHGFTFLLPEGAAPVARTFAYFRLCVAENNGETWLSVADLSLFGTPA